MAESVELRQKALEVWVLEAGEDLLEGLERIALERGVQSAVVLSGFGSLATLAVRNPASDEFPPKMNSTRLTGPFELLSVVGTIGEVAVRHDTVHGKVHVHVSASGRDGSVFGGSLERGSRVFWKVQLNVLVLHG